MGFARPSQRNWSGVEDGVVTLTGTVDTFIKKQAAETCGGEPWHRPIPTSWAGLSARSAQPEQDQPG